MPIPSRWSCEKCGYEDVDPSKVRGCEKNPVPDAVFKKGDWLADETGPRVEIVSDPVVERWSNGRNSKHLVRYETWEEGVGVRRPGQNSLRKKFHIARIFGRG